MTKPLQSNKRLAALIIALFMGIGTAQAEYDFAAACNTGQTLYYQITDFTNFYVSIVAPGNSSEWWPENTVKPANMIVIPQTVSYGGIDFTVTSIANNAFYTCDGLTVLLQVPNTVTSIGNHAFYGCSSLRIANIPNSINSIGYYAFYGCNSLTSITIPNSVRSIRSSAFQNCTGLTSMVVATGNTVYDSRDNCNAIIRTATNTLVAGCKNTLIPNSVTSIGEEAFYDCTGLTSIEIPNSVTSIGGRAFWGCTGLTSVEIPNSVISIGDDAFYNCTGLTSVEIGNSVTSIGECAFEDCTGLTSVEIPNSVTSIEYHAFCGCTGLTSVEIPNSVTSIGGTAFGACRGLTSIEIPNSVTTIESYAFGGCTGLTSITVQAETPPSLSNNAFIYVNNSIPVYVPCGTNSAYRSAPGWKDFNNYIQFGCGIIFADANVKAICIANWDTNGDGRLNYEEAAAVTTLNPSGQSNQSVFRGNTAITSFDELQYFTGLSTIENYAFYGCSGLTSVEIPNSVTSIGSNAFQGCTGLTSIEIPDFVTSIGNYAFRDCTGLATMVVASGNTTYDSRDNCNAIIETATNTLVAGCKNTLIPNSVTSIGNDAFGGCTGLTSVEIPNSVTTIESYAFGGCTGLTSITVQAETPPSLGNNAFIYVNNSIPVYVPCGTNSAYRSAPGWKDFNNYLQFGCGIIFADENVKAICVANWDTNGDGKLDYEEAAAVTTLNPSGQSNQSVFRGNTAITSFDELQYFTGLSTIENYAFSGCSGLTSVEIGNSVTSIGNYAFSGCTGLTSVEIPNSVTSIGNYAFIGCTGLTSVEIPNSVTSIGNAAFQNCTGLTSVEIPNSVTSIGDYAFYGCFSLTSVEIPNSVTSIGNNAFSNCRGLTSIEIPNFVTSIGNYAFYNCSGLTSVEIGNSVTSIGNYAFYNCSGLTSVEIGNSVTSIGNYAFQYCTGLATMVVASGNTTYDSRDNCNAIIETATNTLVAGCKNTLIPNSVTSIGNDAFRLCRGLTSIEIPNSVTSIGNYAFYNCSGLTSVEIGNSVTSIGNHAFSGCTGLTSVEIGNSVTSIGSAAFQNCTGLTSVEIPNSVTSIGNSAFNVCTGLTSVEIPNSVTSIGNGAFSGCSGLTSVTIGNSVTSIGSEAFSGCTGLATMVVASGNTTYDSRDNCNAIIKTATNTLVAGCKNTLIPNSVTSIGSGAFRNCTSLTSIEIPNSVTSIGNYAFGGCTGLTSITVQAETPPSLGNNAFNDVNNSIPVYVPCGTNSAYRSAPGWKDFNNYIQLGCDYIVFADENVKAICLANWDTNGDGKLDYEEAAAVTTLNPSGQSNQSVFRGNTAITSFDELQYFTGLSAIENYAFYYCSGLTSIEIPNSVTSIGDYAFQYCTGLTSIEIPNSVTFIGYYAFYGCSGLTSIEIPNFVISIGNYAFRYCTGLTSIEIPNSVTSIGNYAFDGCSGLTSIEIPNSVTSIGYYTFQNCTGLTSVEIPNSVTSIGGGAFYGCFGLTSIEIPNSVTSIGNEAFNYCSGLATMVVTSGNTTYDSRDNCNAIIETATNILVAGCKNTLIPNSVTSIGNDAFRNCTGLTTVEIPNSVTSIGDYAFQYCTGLTSVEIPNSVTSIGYKAFDGCSGLTSIEIPNSVTSIGHYAFQNCTGLTSVEIPNSVTSIGYYAFAYCCGLTSVEIPNSLTSIGNEAFCGCTGLTSIEIPNSVTSIGESAFAFCGGLTSIIVRAETPPALGWDVFYAVPTDIRVLVPCGFEEAYTSISWGGFSNIHGMCDGTVTATANPTEGGTISGTGPYEGGATCTLTATANEGYGFANWTENGSVVSTEAEYNFTVAGNRDLVANFASTDPIVFADDNVKAMCVANWDTDDDGELSYAEAAAVTDIGQVFRENNTITSFNELQYFVNLTSIGDWAFYNCTALTSIEIPYSVTSIRDYAFLDCSGLISIEIPNSVTSIGWYAFGNCPALTSIEIPNSVTSIGGLAFSGCSGLISIEIPNSVTSIGSRAFGGCTGLTQIVVENGNSVYDSRDNCNAIIETATNSLIAGCKTTVIPNTVTSIGDWAFYNCTALTSIEIPYSVTSIRDYAFLGCSGLISIEIPNSVTSIGEYAFLYCSGLTEITMLRTDVPTLSWGAFYETNDCPIYVPYESLNNYKTTENWSEYEYRIYPMAYIAVSGYGTGGGKWKFIASPLTDNTEPTAVSNMTGTEYDLYRFNQSAELEWENYKVHDFDLVNEQGYLYANTEDVNLVFKGTFNEGSSQTITLIYDEGKDFAGWNLVGNPFPVQAYANRSYYTMNAAGTAIEPTAASTSTAIPACTGVMVKAETTGQSVTFSKTAPSAATNNGALQIAVAQANTRGAAVQDKAIVSFNAGDELGKFYFGESNAKLYIPQNGKELAIATAAKTGELPLNFKAEKNGEYTLSFDVANVIASEAKQSNLSEQFAYLHLIDNMNGADVDLLVSPEYTFNAKTSDYASRFRLVFSANESDGDNDGDNAFAFIDAGGNIVINGEGTLQVIDMMGRVVVCRDASNASAISTNGIPAGVYILRLINGNDVMTQKIVIE